MLKVIPMCLFKFRFPYRIVFAVATQNSVLFYDSQQSMPFACVSQIHYLRLTDIAWSHDGRMLIVTSTDGFGTFITFGPNEIGIPYDGPKFSFNENLETSPVNKTLNTSKAADKMKGEVTPELDRQTKKLSESLKSCTPSITSFFKPKANQSVDNHIDIKNDSSSFNGVKRKEIIDLTDDSDDSTSNNNYIAKKPNCMRSPLKDMDKNMSTPSGLNAPSSAKIKDISVRKLEDEFEEAGKVPQETHVNDIEMQEVSKAELSHKPAETIKCQKQVEDTNGSHPPFTLVKPADKQPRRLNFITLSKNL